MIMSGESPCTGVHEMLQYIKECIFSHVFSSPKQLYIIYKILIRTISTRRKYIFAGDMHGGFITSRLVCTLCTARGTGIAHISYIIRILWCSCVLPSRRRVLKYFDSRCYYISRKTNETDNDVMSVLLFYLTVWDRYMAMYMPYIPATIHKGFKVT